jgi:hypothetical protein
LGNEKRGAVFRQSLNDFPLTVELGEKEPSWGLARWGGKGLRFIPPADERFTLRGDKQRLEYKGRRRSHRFAILGDTAFEYDCILEREPDSNVISLYMVGAEDFDFYRQPDFVADPFLKGSYAVYKKLPTLGEGTGKLCHINRPEIVDARGRRCWGELAVKGSMLYITIPEDWLGEAAYPVVVDPVVGTATVGSQTTGVDPIIDWMDRPLIDNHITLSRYFVEEKAAGLCTAYIYCYWTSSSSPCNPVIFTDNNDLPYLRKSENETNIEVKVSASNPEGWKNGFFNIKGEIQAGSYIWFGFRPRTFTTRFDYSADEHVRIYNGYNQELLSVIEPEDIHVRQAIRFSWYFTYTAAQDYVRALIEGVSLFDNKFRAGRVQISKITDGVHVAMAAFRYLFFLVRIKTVAATRDYLLRRILKARSELELKSVITKEIILESRIH